MYILFDALYKGMILSFEISCGQIFKKKKSVHFSGRFGSGRDISLKKWKQIWPSSSIATIITEWTYLEMVVHQAPLTNSSQIFHGVV